MEDSRVHVGGRAAFARGGRLVVLLVLGEQGPRALGGGGQPLLEARRGRGRYLFPLALLRQVHVLRVLVADAAALGAEDLPGPQAHRHAGVLEARLAGGAPAHGSPHVVGGARREGACSAVRRRAVRGRLRRRLVLEVRESLGHAVRSVLFQTFCWVCRTGRCEDPTWQASENNHKKNCEIASAISTCQMLVLLFSTLDNGETYEVSKTVKDTVTKKGLENNEELHKPHIDTIIRWLKK